MSQESGMIPPTPQEIRALARILVGGMPAKQAGDGRYPMYPLSIQDGRTLLIVLAWAEAWAELQQKKGEP